MLRDGLLIALLAARAMRLRSVESSTSTRGLRRIDGHWHVLLGPEDVKTGRPVTYAVPPSLGAWIDRYLTVERVELLGGPGPATRSGSTGTASRSAPRGIEKRIRWWSAKQFGPNGASGRTASATASPPSRRSPTRAPRPTAPRARHHRTTFAEAYDRGERETVAARPS